MLDFFIWAIFIFLIGWAAFPICFNIFRNAFDRGYAIAKAIGLIIWGYSFWIGNLCGVLSNDRGGALAAFLGLLIFLIFTTKKNDLGKIAAWIKENRQIWVFQEAVFTTSFLIWALVRAANPEIVATEKPMELAFINAIYRSPSFPPSDPWLAGYSISYYYFGYLLVAAIMHVVGTSSGTAFNLAVALIFALSAAGCSGILFALLANKEEGKRKSIDKPRIRKFLLLSLLAGLLVLIMGNAEGLLEMMHSRGLFWTPSSDGQRVSVFWQWLDIQELTNAPSLALDWKPSRMGGSWWWRASRVLKDTTVAGQNREIIDEFPFFSFLLADLHPHVLAIPFVLANILCGFYFSQNPIHKGQKEVGITAILKDKTLWFLAFVVGSLIFINTWDFPIYFGLIVSVYLISRIQEFGWEKKRIHELLSFALPLGIACILIYLPFLITLSSQAGGLLPSMVFRTRGIHFLVMFFPQAAILSVFLLGKIKNKKDLTKIITIFLFGMILLLAVFLITLVTPIVSQKMLVFLTEIGSALNLDFSRTTQTMLLSQQGFLAIYEATGISELVEETVRRFINHPFLPLFLLAILSISVWLIFSPKRKEMSAPAGSKMDDKSDRFVFLLIMFGALLALFPEFFYLRDQFGWRMNTIFKFYYQVWILFSLASAYAIANLHAFVPNRHRVLISVGSFFAIGIGLIYPYFSIINKTNMFSHIEWSLDGNQYFRLSDAEEDEAIQFLTQQPYGRIVEAIGGSYSIYGRVSRMSGFPTILGWPGHEMQWRGGVKEIGTREGDVRFLYESSDWVSAQEILDRYDITYIIIGSLERNTYQVKDDKFTNHLVRIFSNSTSDIYWYAGSE